MTPSAYFASLAAATRLHSMFLQARALTKSIPEQQIAEHAAEVARGIAEGFNEDALFAFHVESRWA